MNIVSFEEKAFSEIALKFDYFVRKVDELCERHQRKELKQWMDHGEVCRVLNISPRTLQTLRDNGTLAYSKIGNRTFYRDEDVQRIVSVVEKRREKAIRKGREI